jgi:hypothetical protein
MRVRSTSASTPLVLVTLLAGCASPPTPAPAAPELAAVRQATERFRDVNVALAEGYIRDPNNMCVTAEMEGQLADLGAMGIHYIRPDLLGITGAFPRVTGTGTHTDFMQPGILIYEPQRDGKLELIAVENLVFADAWKARGHASPPSFAGVSFNHMADDPGTPADEAHGFAPHYDLHLWLYRSNPAGVFSTFNTRVSCHNHAAHAAR